MSEKKLYIRDMKDKKKITITYNETVTRTITCYAPHSKYILRRNIITTFLFVLFGFVMFMPVVMLTNDTQMILLGIGIGVIFIIISLYTLIDEWRNGRGYKLAIKMIQNNTNKEERDRALAEFKKQENIQ